MTTRQALCALDLTPADLSAWRSHALPEDDYRRIAAHIPTCRACQATLADYAGVADALRGQHVPPTGAPLWRATQTKITAYERSRMNRSQRYIIAGGLGLLGVLVLTVTIVLASSLNPATSTTNLTAVTQPTGTGKPHKQPTKSPTMHPTPTAIPLPGGWTDARVGYAKDVAFSATDPQTGYVCGNLYNGSQTNPPPLELGVTHDGGATWQGPMTLPFNYGDCRVQVNPFNAQDLLIGEFVCYGCDGDSLYPRTWYRSLDGGATWNVVSIPAGAGADSSHLIQYFMWGGQTLYMQIQEQPGDYTILHLAHSYSASINGGAFTWIDSDLATASASLGKTVFYGQIGTVGSTLLLPYNSGSHYGFLTTSDGGATWSHFLTQGFTSQRLYPSLDGTTIYASSYRTASRSVDGGHTWITLPAIPAPSGALLDYRQPLVANVPANTNGPLKEEFVETDDGTVFYGVDANGTLNHNMIYEVSPGATQWHLRDNQGPGTFAAVSADASGHPTAVWDTLFLITPGGPPIATPSGFGLASHAAP